MSHFFFCTRLTHVVACELEVSLNLHCLVLSQDRYPLGKQGMSSTAAAAAIVTAAATSTAPATTPTPAAIPTPAAHITTQTNKQAPITWWAGTKNALVRHFPFCFSSYVSLLVVCSATAPMLWRDGVGGGVLFDHEARQR